MVTSKKVLGEVKLAKHIENMLKVIRDLGDKGVMSICMLVKPIPVVVTVIYHSGL